MTVVFLTLGACALLIMIELFRRHWGGNVSLWRRSGHVGASLINIAAPVFLSSQEIIAMNLAFAALLVVGRFTSYLSVVKETKRHTYGDVFLPLGIVLAALALLPDHQVAFQYGVAIMGISDALAGFIGERWGKVKVRLLGNTKSIEGSAAFFLSSLAITYLFHRDISVGFFALPLLLSVVEFGLVFGLDNLILPVLAGHLFLLFM